MTENKPSGIIIKEIGNILNEQGETLIDLEIENEELKQSIQKAYTILQEADLFSDKATKHDIFAYSDMLKMDNKDAYIIAIGIKEALKILKEMIE